LFPGNLVDFPAARRTREIMVRGRGQVVSASFN